MNFFTTFSTLILYRNIDQILPNKSHGPMHYTIGVTRVYNEHVLYTDIYAVVIT